MQSRVVNRFRRRLSSKWRCPSEDEVERGRYGQRLRSNGWANVRGGATKEEVGLFAKDPHCGCSTTGRSSKLSWCGAIIQIFQRFHSIKNYTNEFLGFPGYASQNLRRVGTSCIWRESIRTFSLNWRVSWNRWIFLAEVSPWSFYGGRAVDR